MGQPYKDSISNLDSMEEDGQRNSPMDIESRPVGLTGFDLGKLKKIHNNDETNLNTLPSNRLEIEDTEHSREKTETPGVLLMEEDARRNEQCPEESGRHANPKAGRSSKGKIGGRRSSPMGDRSTRTKSGDERDSSRNHCTSRNTRGRSRSPRKDESVSGDSHNNMHRSRNFQSLQHLENGVGGST